MKEPEINYNPDYATHPGEMFREWVEGHPKWYRECPMWTDIDDLQDITNQREGARVTVELADTLEHLTGIKASLWLNIQAQYDSHPNSHYRCIVHDHWEGGKHQCPRGKYCPKCGGKVEKH